MNTVKLKRAFTNSLLALLFLGGGYIHLKNFWLNSRAADVTHVLLFFQLSLIAVLCLIRREPLFVSWHPWDMLVSFLALFALLFFSKEGGNGIRWPGVAVQIAGNFFSILSLFSLGRSFGILPAHRGIRKGGMYRIVRHPVYASYQLVNLGYVMNHPSLYNLAVACVCLASQILRIFAEERLLSRDPEYVRYTNQVRWRLLPFVF